MWLNPRIYLRSRSNPRPKPPWGAPPNRRRSRYLHVKKHTKVLAQILVVYVLLKQTSSAFHANSSDEDSHWVHHNALRANSRHTLRQLPVRGGQLLLPATIGWQDSQNSYFPHNFLSSYSEAVVVRSRVKWLQCRWKILNKYRKLTTALAR